VDIAMTSGVILYGQHDDVHVLRFVGEIRYPSAPGLQQFVDKLLADKPLARIAIDLTETTLIDSTNLGLLAHLAQRVSERGGPRVTILSTRNELNEMLRSMAFDEVFDLVAGEDGHPGASDVIRSEPGTREETVQTVLQAHRALMKLSQHNHQTFREVVRALEQSLGRSEPS
jgi:anti-anti-sigma factor